MQAQQQSSPAAGTRTSSPTFGLLTGPIASSLNPYHSSFPLRDSVAAPPSDLAQTTGLAHDAGNLLGALGLYCELLHAPGVLRPEHHHYARELALISSRSSDLIRRLLTLAPPHSAAAHPPLLVERPAGRTPYSPSSNPNLDPTTLYRPHNNTAGPGPQPSLATALRNLAPILCRIAAGAAHVTVLVPATLPSIDLSPEVLERIAVNLVRNAAEAIRSANTTHPDATAGRILVALAVVHGRLQLSVDDNGPGMPPALAAAFLRPSPLPPGAVRGLGHRIIHELVASTNGQLSVRARPGSGTAFCLKWPIPATAVGAHPC